MCSVASALLLCGPMLRSVVDSGLAELAALVALDAISRVAPLHCQAVEHWMLKSTRPAQIRFDVKTTAEMRL